MLSTLAVNVGVATWERRMGRKLNSELLFADASHTGSDILVSIGVLVGLVAVRLGWPAADPLLALLVAAAIVWTAVQVLRQADLSLSDTARLGIPDVCAAALAVPGVLGCHSIRTRGTSADILVDLHVQVDPALTVAAGHLIAEAVERAVSERFPEVADVIAHLEPHDEYQARKTARGERPHRTLTGSPGGRPLLLGLQRGDLLLELLHDLLEGLLREQLRELLAIVADGVDLVHHVVDDEPPAAAAREVVVEGHVLVLEEGSGVDDPVCSPAASSPRYSNRLAR